MKSISCFRPETPKSTIPAIKVASKCFKYPSLHTKWFKTEIYTLLTLTNKCILSIICVTTNRLLMCDYLAASDKCMGQMHYEDACMRARARAHTYTHCYDPCRKFVFTFVSVACVLHLSSLSSDWPFPSPVIQLEIAAICYPPAETSSSNSRLLCCA